MDDCFVSDLLTELLTECNRVSLPCLGSFIADYAPATISPDGEYISPPSKKVAFHQNEIWNDEKLEKLIAIRLNISIGNAKEQLAFWIDNICVALATGEKVVLPGLGILRVSHNSKLEFKQKSPNILSESFGLETVPLPKHNVRDPDFGYSDSIYARSKRVSPLIIILIVISCLSACAAAAYLLLPEEILNHLLPIK